MIFSSLIKKKADLTTLPETATLQEALTVLENTGSYDTDEVLQAYIRAEDSAFAPLHPSLCAFTRVNLKAGERKEVKLSIPASSFTIVDEEGRRYVDGTHFSLYVGTSQPDERSAQLTGMRPVKIALEL